MVVRKVLALTDNCRCSSQERCHHGSAGNQQGVPGWTVHGRILPRCPRLTWARSYLTIILVMETLPLSHVKAHLSEIADRVEGQHDRIVVTRKGRPAAVLVSPEDLESLEETLAVLSDPELMRQIRASEAEVEGGEEGTTLEELKAELGRRDAA